MINIKDTLILLTSIALLISAGFLNEALIKPDLDIKKQDSAVNINSDFLKLFGAGNSRLISDLLWITTLLESDHEHYKQKDLNSWMYLRFKTIATLDPLFLQNYQFGGKYLSVVKDDSFGAREIFDVGLSIYPKDYELLFNTAFLYYFDLKDYKKAYKLYSKVVTYPQSPVYIKTLLPKLKFEFERSIDDVIYYLDAILLKEKDEYMISKIKSDLYSIHATIDLKCLNKSISNKRCRKEDYFGNKYIMMNGLFKSQLKFKEYKLNIK